MKHMSLKHHAMSFGDHLEELRRRLIICLIAPIPFIIVGFFFGEPLIEWLWEPCRRVLEAHDLPNQMQVLSPTEAFVIWMKVSIILGLVITSPVIVYQTWAFVAPGLYARERRFAYVLVPMSVVLVAAGLIFLYTVLIPVSMNFLIGFGSKFEPPERVVEVTPNTDVFPQIPVVGVDPTNPVEGQIWFKVPENQLRIVKSGRVLIAPFSAKTLLAQQIQLHKYINMVLVLSLVFPIAFQLPVIMLLLGWSGMVEPDDLARIRRYAVFGCAVAGAILTPADPWSMLALAGPLYLLYELGILLMRVLPASRVAEGFGGRDSDDGKDVT
ncbi:MAG: twin-arginine translocase subunit TatC [Phycisphaerales bacterium]|nr:twin-arginine translocase subunit TatC [Phycisphaerales bacterium]